MPKRSNDFQRLVYLTRLNLSGGAKVSESKLMRDRLTKSLREVDVVIEGKVGNLPVVVSIECRDHKRVADVGWVEAMKAKHERLATNALFLASKSGFTAEALAVAAKYGIETFTLEDVESRDLSSLLGAHGSLWLKTTSVSATKVSIRVAAVAGLTPETVATSPDNLLYSGDGAEIGSVQDLVERILRSRQVAEYLQANAREDHVWFEVVWGGPRSADGRPLFMKKLEPTVLRPAESIRVVGPCKVEIARFGMRGAKLGSVQIAWGKFTVSGQSAMAVATVLPSGEPKLSVNVAGSPAD